jgi:aminopeptidase YwaD
VTRLSIIMMFWLISSVAKSQIYNPNINSELSNLKGSVSLVEQFESFGIKAPGSQEKTNTFNWIVQQYQDIGYDSIRVDSFVQDGTIARNIVVTKQGLTPNYLVVCGHYDTRGGPGASDNGSGVSAIIQAAKLLKDLQTTRSIQFIHFDREEDGFKGSNYHVTQILGGASVDTNLYMVFNVDQIGGSRGQADNDKITCERDEENNPSFNNARSYLITDTISNLCNLYTSLAPEISNAFLSDYIPFEQQGYVITGLYQSAPDVFGHNPADTVGNMDTISFKQAVRLTAASVMHFAQVDRFVSVPKTNAPKVHLFPNPADHTIFLRTVQPILSCTLIDMTGRVLLNVESSDIKKMDISDLHNGIYTLVLSFSGGESTLKKCVIQH